MCVIKYVFKSASIEDFYELRYKVNIHGVPALSEQKKYKIILLRKVAQNGYFYVSRK